MENCSDATHVLSSLEQFLRQAGVGVWPERLKAIRLSSDEHQNHERLRSDIVSLFRGTMGSFHEVVISRQNGDCVEDEVQANLELERLKDELRRFL